jgi:4-carboxymuconolactone decarboxylase
MSKENVAKGEALMRKMLGEQSVKPRPRFPQWDEWAKGTLFGELWSGQKLDLRTRSLVTIAALTMQCRTEQLAAHIRGGLNNGATPDEIAEVIMQMGLYGGWSCGGIGLGVLDKVLTEMGK